ncbi:MAG: Hsp20/alpha crystallin family protein [bacterium]
MLVQVRHHPTYSYRNEISDFEREIERLFSNTFSSPSDSSATPAINVVENETQTVIVAELPGVQKEDVKLSVEKGILSIHAHRKTNGLPEKATWLRNEISSGDFNRSVRLPKGIEAEKISAELTNGILKIVVPKAEAVKPHEIKVS